MSQLSRELQSLLHAQCTRACTENAATHMLNFDLKMALKLLHYKLQNSYLHNIVFFTIISDFFKYMFGILGSFIKKKN